MVTRREVLVGALAMSSTVLLAACSTASDAEPEASAPIGGDDALRRDVAAAEHALISRYDAAIAGATSALVPLLTRIRDEHRDHLAAVGGAMDASTPSQAPEPVDALRSAEREAARARRTAAVTATDGDLTRVLTLIAASEAGHVVALREAGR